MLSIVLLIFSITAFGQAPTSGLNLNPNEVAEMKKRMDEMDIQRAAEAAARAKIIQPLAPIPVPGQLPSGAMDPANPGAPSIPPPLQQPLLAPLPPNLSTTVPINTKVLEQSVANRVKSPFMIPNELYLKLMRKKSDSPTEGLVDLSVEEKRRWALKYYKLVGVIWNVKNPKAMITDKEGKLHLFKEKEYIANQEGFITEISNGEVVVLERGLEVKLKLAKQ